MKKSPTKSSRSKTAGSRKKSRAKSPATSPPKCNQVARRPSDAAVADAVDWIIRGATERQLREALAEGHPEQRIDDVLAAAVRHFQQAANVDGWALRGWLLECWRTVYQKALAIGDFTTAIKALQRLEMTADKELPPEENPSECSPPLQEAPAPK